MPKQYKRITRGRRAGQVASPWRQGVKPECIHEYHVSELLKVVYDYYDLTPAIDEHAVRQAYSAVAGQLISQLTRSIHFSEGILSLTIDSAALKQELQFRRSALAQSINSHLGHPLVKEIRIY